MIFFSCQFINKKFYFFFFWEVACFPLGFTVSSSKVASIFEPDFRGFLFINNTIQIPIKPLKVTNSPVGLVNNCKIPLSVSIFSKAYLNK